MTSCPAPFSPTHYARVGLFGEGAEEQIEKGVRQARPLARRGRSGRPSPNPLPPLSPPDAAPGLARRSVVGAFEPRRRNPVGAEVGRLLLRFVCIVLGVLRKDMAAADFRFKGDPLPASLAFSSPASSTAGSCQRRPADTTCLAVASTGPTIEREGGAGGRATSISKTWKCDLSLHGAGGGPLAPYRVGGRGPGAGRRRQAKRTSHQRCESASAWSPLERTSARPRRPPSPRPPRAPAAARRLARPATRPARYARAFLRGRAARGGLAWENGAEVADARASTAICAAAAAAQDGRPTPFPPAPNWPHFTSERTSADRAIDGVLA